VQQGEPARAGVAIHVARWGAAGAAGAPRQHSAGPLQCSLLSQHPLLMRGSGLCFACSTQHCSLVCSACSALLPVLAGAAAALRLKCRIKLTHVCRIQFTPTALQGQGTQRPPLLFVHGSFHAAWCWREHFMPHFAAAGWVTLAVSLRGQVSKEQPCSVARPCTRSSSPLQQRSSEVACPPTPSSGSISRARL